MEQLLIQYVELRGRLYVHDKCGLSYMYMKIKTLKWARQLLSPEAVATFSASDGWINATLAHYNLQGLKLAGPGGRSPGWIAASTSA